MWDTLLCLIDYRTEQEISGIGKWMEVKKKTDNTLEKTMEREAVVTVNKEHFGYDIHSLLKAFYPEKNIRCVFGEEEKKEDISKGEEFASFLFHETGAEVSLEGESFSWKNLSGKGMESKGYKALFGSFLYQTLCTHTGRRLPWGSLIGIRPTKIAYTFLEEGKSEEEILEIYKNDRFVSEKKARLGIEIAAREREILKVVEHTEKVSVCGVRKEQDPHGFTKGYSLYIGIPFCPTTCLYCSFTSFPIASYRKLAENYIDCVIKEMEFTADRFKDKILDSVYIGGGTPTTLEPEQLDRLLRRLKSLFDFSTVKEFTVEAGRADSITEEKLQVLQKYGVSRISINPQTMKQETLDVIGRKASVEQVLQAYELARSLKFDNINMDIILGLPGETAEDVKYTTDRIAELAPDSLTVHSLATKRASALNQWIREHGMSALNNTEETMEIASGAAKKMGMNPYYLYRQKNMSGNLENVGYAKPGKYGLYNILIMEEVQTIAALGAGTVTKMVLPDGRIERCDNVKDVKLYMDQIDEMIERKRRLYCVLFSHKI